MTAAQQSLVEKCLLHTLEVTKTSSAPISRQKLFNDFMAKGGIQRSRTFLNNKIPEMLAMLASMDEGTVEEKARWMFVTSTPFTALNEKRNQKYSAELHKLKNAIENSGAAVWNERDQIVKYSDKAGVVKFEGVHGPRTGTAGRKQRKQAKEASKSSQLVGRSDMGNESSHVDSDFSQEKSEKTPSKPRPASIKLVKETRKSAPKSRKLIETSSDESDEEAVRFTQNSSQEKSKKALSNPRPVLKMSMKKTRKSAPISKEIIETSSDESDVDASPAPKTPSSNGRKRTFSTSKAREVTAVTDKAVEEESSEVQAENLDPADFQSIQVTPEEPSSKRMCVDIDNDEVLKTISNIKPEIDDDIIFEGIVVKKDKPKDLNKIFLFRPSILGGMTQYSEEFEEEEIRNIHSLGFINCMKVFLEGVFGISSEKALEMQDNISRLIEKLEVDPKYMAMDIPRLYAILDDNLARLAAQTANKEDASKNERLNFLRVLKKLKESCDTKMTPELLKEVDELIDEQIEECVNQQEMISGDSILEVMRRMMQDIKH